MKNNRPILQRTLPLLLCVFMITGCNGGRTQPEYRYADFVIQEIHDGYAYVVPVDQYEKSNDPDVYAIDLKLFDGQVYEAGSKVQVAYTDIDKEDPNGLEAHSVAVEAQ